MKNLEWVLGAVPAWLELGPEEEVDGFKVRRVLGDWSHMIPEDRPPEFVIIEWSTPPPSPLRDRSEDRPALPQRLPGKRIAELKGVHSGKVAILFNGASLAAHDLSLIRCPIIGMNRTHAGNPGYSGPQPDYLCIIDPEWFENENVLRHPRIINGGLDPRPIGYRVTRSLRMEPFSFDLERDGFVSPIPCTTGHLALQAAVYMGFTELYCLGLDMAGGHFDGTKASMHFSFANRYHQRQAPLLREHGIKVYVCGSPESKCQAFEHVPFEALLAA